MQGWMSRATVPPAALMVPHITLSSLRHPLPPALPPPRPADGARGRLSLAKRVRGIPPATDLQGKREVEGKPLCLRNRIIYFSCPQLQASLQITQFQHCRSS